MHDFSGEVQKFSGEVHTSPQNPAMMRTKPVGGSVVVVEVKSSTGSNLCRRY